MISRSLIGAALIAALCIPAFLIAQTPPAAPPASRPAGRGGRGGGGMGGRPMTISSVGRQPDNWFRSADGRRAIDNILDWEGKGPENIMGWPKSYNVMEPYDRVAAAGHWHGVATIDNDATWSEIRALARAISVEDPGPRLDKIKKGFYAAVDMLITQQYPNGGWAQRFPLADQEPYGEHITYNDNAMTSVMEQFKLIAEKSAPYAFVDEDHRKKVQESLDRAVDCTLKCQIVAAGKLTVWCAQFDSKTLAPAKARAYELPSLSGGESSEITLFFMSFDKPTDRMKKSVDAAYAWFDAVKIPNKRLTQIFDSEHREVDRILVDAPGSTSWARFVEIGTNRPIFVGRDSIVRYNLADIEFERRTGYGFYGSWPQRVMDAYPEWKKRVGG